MVLQDLIFLSLWVVFLLSFFLSLSEIAAGKCSLNYCVKFAEYWKEGKINSSFNSFCWPQIPGIAAEHRGCKLHCIGFGDGTQPQLRTHDGPTSNFLEGSFALKSVFTNDLLSVLPEECTE